MVSEVGYNGSLPDPSTREILLQAEEWPRWIRRFERFRQASGLATKTEENQVNTLVYSMGEKADDNYFADI